ncbi:hypothetical protein Q6348_08335 [Isoptericola sp. b441]|uniref:Polysaccharide lyase 14 domain-containing protein n=1 Tax=Actinotalea lenta TaxID=3064654 RepID=A0ABT9DDV4_9CELL|nr:MULTISPECIES: hypothetical protein [unclassified Isoptericola]MDO8107202.1 hypothetical protein [Isoptericola sp. b441]MDO8121120.1 hypothetical protein [Isoptericola sp. b490]
MRDSRRLVPAVVVAVAVAFLGAVFVPRMLSGRDASPAPAAPTLADFFGPQVRLRDKGAFGGGQVLEKTPGRSMDVLRVDYPRNSVSPSATRSYGAPLGGMQVYLPLADGPVDEAYLRYWVRFQPGFEFARGGKLPGLYGGTKVSGGKKPDGTDGLSTRLMWRSGGRGEVYLYARDRAGDSLGRGDWTFRPGRWTCVQQHVRLNHPGDENGLVSVRIDGHEVFSDGSIEYRTTEDLHVDGIFFSTFFGGHEPKWASPQDQHTDFAGFELSTDHRVGCGQAPS